MRFRLRLDTYHASLTFFVSGHAQHGFSGFFSSVPSVTAAGSQLAADRVDIFRLKRNTRALLSHLLPAIYYFQIPDNVHLFHIEIAVTVHSQNITQSF